MTKISDDAERYDRSLIVEMNETKKFLSLKEHSEISSYLPTHATSGATLGTILSISFFRASFQDLSLFLLAS